MDRDVVFKYIRFISKKVYKFNYALMGDELRAEQLFVDTFSAFLMKRNEEINKIDESDQSAARTRKWFYMEMMKESYELASKRWQQVEKSQGARSGYSSLSTLQKATIFLKEVEGLPVEDASKICSVSNSTLIQTLYNTRDFMVNDFHSSKKFKEGAVELS